MRMAEASNDCSLPEEIVIIEIFPRLPVKSLLRFRSVCKSWLTQISNPNFTKLHLDRSANKTPLSLIAYSYIAVRNIPNFASGVPLISLIHLDSLENTPSSSVVNLDQPPLLIRADLVGSYNGIVCLGDEDFICLWNPATRQYKHLPPPLYVTLLNNSCPIPRWMTHIAASQMNARRPFLSNWYLRLELMNHVQSVAGDFLLWLCIRDSGAL